MSGKHSQMLRGLEATNKAPNFQGRFGRMFPKLSAAHYGKTTAESEEALRKLGEKMTADFDPPKDGPDPEESGIPALYTYFGQFVDHDITFDPNSSLQKQNDPQALTDFRTPALDLDNVYGRGPGDQPYMYDGDMNFLQGNPLTLGDAHARDLPRNGANPSRALIGDPRNDENSIVSQLQGLFHRFHNRTVADNPGMAFEKVQERVRFHYQYVVVHDFLPRIIEASVLQSLKTGNQYDSAKIKFFNWNPNVFMPVEFSVAAYRLGHSMIRPGYRLNDAVLVPIFPIPHEDEPGFGEGLTGFRAMISDWGIDWARFIDVEHREYSGSKQFDQRRLQFAYRIDTSIVNPLKHLPEMVAAKPSSLAERNLLRSFRLGLPSGQLVAEAMGIKPLTDDDIRVGKAENSPKGADVPVPITKVSKVFAGTCPLWTYILAEAMHHRTPERVPVKGNVTIKTPQLGPVGGRIVAETFLGMLFGDSASLLNVAPKWHPAGRPNYKLKDFVNYALGK